MGDILSNNEIIAFLKSKHDIDEIKEIKKITLNMPIGLHQFADGFKKNVQRLSDHLERAF